MQPTEGTVTAAPTDEGLEITEQTHEPAEGAEGAHGADIHLPPPSIWPMTTAAGMAISGFGLVTTLVLSFLGLIIMAWGMMAWIQELRHERH